jgi:hypothetical protein
MSSIEPDAGYEDNIWPDDDDDDRLDDRPWGHEIARDEWDAWDSLEGATAPPRGS